MRALAVALVILGFAGLTIGYTGVVVRRARGGGIRPNLPPRRYSARGGAFAFATNYRGERLPVVLGYGLVSLVFWVQGFPGHAVIHSLTADSNIQRLSIEGSILLVLLAGMYDDYRGNSPRGLRKHFSELAQGRLTSGIAKALVILGAATLSAFGLGHGLPRILLGIPVLAGSANVWNMLDVRPGRALKAFLVAALVLIGWYARYEDLLLGAAIGSAAALLLWDLRERAMLGDAGSNVLGFVIGLALYRVLPTWGLAIAFGVILVLHAAGETVTLSRIVQATPPLRWFDRLGRVHVDGTDERSPEDSSIE